MMMVMKVVVVVVHPLHLIRNPNNSMIRITITITITTKMEILLNILRILRMVIRHRMIRLRQLRKPRKVGNRKTIILIIMLMLGGMEL